MFAARKTDNVSSAANYIEEVFSTYLYTGNGSTQTITNGIDLSTKGGLVWLKGRSVGYNNGLFDTVRGADFLLCSNNTDPSTSVSGIPASAWITSFNSNGFGLGSNGAANNNGTTYVSWTFRKQAKFFDVVTYTGDGNTSKTVSHSLGSVPGMMIIKSTTSARDWAVYYGDNTSYLVLNLDNVAATTATIWNNTSPTSTQFTVGNNSRVNESGQTYVAYLFANNAGGFGATGADNVISCGSFTPSSGAATVTLGYEPQFVILKNISAVENWITLDTMRGWVATAGGERVLNPNLSAAESGGNLGNPTATGFETANLGTGTYIYIAIRRGPMKTPTSGTSVFNAIARSGTSAAATVTGVGFPPDLALTGSRSGTGHTFIDRLRGTPLLITHLTNAEATYSNEITSFNMDGISLGNNTGGGYTNLSGQTYIPWYFRRAPGFFDVVCYTGTGVARTVSHNLGVAPELMIVKGRSFVEDWAVYSSDSSVGSGKALRLNSISAPITTSTYWNSTAPTASQFSVGATIVTNTSGGTLVAYLFATVAGVSKVGGYTGNGSSQTINCGFTAGARFILIKRTDSTGDWYVWDTARGIVAGNDPRLSLNSTAAEVTTDDSIDPDNSGFIVNQLAATNINVSSATYIYLAIA